MILDRDIKERDAAFYEALAMWCISNDLPIPDHVKTEAMRRNNEAKDRANRKSVSG